MIYFLVNNNYHLVDVNKHLKSLKDFEKSLIQIPHTLELVKEDENFKNIYTFNSPFIGLKNFFNYFKINQTHNIVKNELIIDKNDILFVYSEYEILNQFIITLFKKSGAKVYILDENSLSTYLTYSVKSDDKLNLKQKIKLYWLKNIIGYKYTKYLYFNGIVFPQLDDKFIDGLLMYNDIKNKRDIKNYLIKNDVVNIKLDSKKAMFLNEKMYDYYCTKEEHSKILNDILNNLSQKFEIVWFKFHPRENEANKEWQYKIIEQYKNVKIVNDNSPIENIIEEYNAKYIFSFFAVALLNLKELGCVPIYLFHFYDEIMRNTAFKEHYLTLQTLNYQFLKDYNIPDFNSVGFNHNISQNYTLEKFIK